MSRGTKKYPLEDARLSKTSDEVKLQFKYKGEDYTIRFSKEDFAGTKKFDPYCFTAKVTSLEPAHADTRTEEQKWQDFDKAWLDQP